MPPEFLPHLFERFTQVASSANSGRRGTGIGMAIVKQLLDLMEGQIAVESTLGEGTRCTVRLTLPLAAAGDGTEDSEGERDQVNLRGLKVLYAEDNPINRDVVDMLLEDSGVELTMVEDGQQAIQRILGDGERYDAILMDIQMPQMDGLQATEALCARFGRHELPIIGVSANALDSHREAALAAGMNAYLAKPVMQDDLLRELARVVGGTEMARSAPVHAAEQGAASRMFDHGELMDHVGSEEMADRVLRNFLANSEATFQRLVDGTSSARIETLRDALHSFKGSMLTIHANPLLAHLEGMHQLARDGDLDGVAAGMPLLRKLYDETLEAVRSSLSEAKED